MSVRARIAPSPTGAPHLGTAYAALFNWALAKSRGGQFVVRIEDTDASRSSAHSERAILDALAWLGIQWDEGPDIGGPHAPYRQSERREIYGRWVDRLLQAGHAFHCFCSPERLAELRTARRATGEASGYDGHCLGLAPEELAQRLASGQPRVVRLKVPREGVCRFRDELRGAIEIPFRQIDMQVLLKADGLPTYHLAAVVDDQLMGITHVMRGEEWISSVPKHKLLCDRLGWELPKLIHLPLLRDRNRGKLSKRRHPTGIDHYRAQGYLPEALVNYLATMGWSMPDGREIFSRDEFRRAFDPNRIALGGPAFDLQKLNWMNGQHLRLLKPAAFLDRLLDWFGPRPRLEALAPLVQQRSERFVDVLAQVDYLLGERRSLRAEDFRHRRLAPDAVAEILFRVSRDCERLGSWDRKALHDACRNSAQRMELKFGDFLFPLFVAISGRPVALPLFDSMAFLGPDRTRARLRDALDVLGISKAQRKRLEKLSS